MYFDVFFVLLITVAALGLGCHKAARIAFNVPLVCVFAQVFYCL